MAWYRWYLFTAFTHTLVAFEAARYRKAKDSIFKGRWHPSAYVIQSKLHRMMICILTGLLIFKREIQIAPIQSSILSVNIEWLEMTPKRTFRKSRCMTAIGRVKMWRGGLRFSLSVAAPFVWRCLNSCTITPFPHPPHRTGQADFPIRLSDKTSRLHPRHVASQAGQTYKT